MSLWMGVPENLCRDAYIAVFRGRFTVEHPGVMEIRFSADERCQLFLDGNLTSDGPERGCPERWYFRDEKLELEAGEHTLCARVLCFNQKFRAAAQMSLRHGFYIAGLPQDCRWDCTLEELDFELPFPDWGSYPRFHLPETYNAGIFAGAGDQWQSVEYFEDDRKLFPPDLPPMATEKLALHPVSGNLHRFDDYVMAYYTVKLSGKGSVRLRWSECPYLNDNYNDIKLYADKGNRDGNVFVGNYDTFAVNGEVEFRSFFWRAGRYLEIDVDGDVRYEFDFYRTGYPLPPLEKKANQLEKMAYNTLRNCCWETFMDCPFYEQLMYVGDSRIEALCLYYLNGDISLVRKALRIFAAGIRPDGSLHSQYPSKNEQNIPAFSATFLLMAGDYFDRFGKDEVISEISGKLEQVGFYLLAGCEKDNLWNPDGWGFVDWCKAWKRGEPAPGKANAPLNFIRVLALKKLSEITGRSDFAAAAERSLNALREKYFDSQRQMYADDPEHSSFSEHSQVLALLCGVPENEQKMLITALEKGGLIPCGIYFSYYYMSMCRRYGLKELERARLAKFYKLQSENLLTLPEEFDAPRSDCHAWSSHILLSEFIRQ